MMNNINDALLVPSSLRVTEGKSEKRLAKDRANEEKRIAAKKQAEQDKLAKFSDNLAKHIETDPFAKKRHAEKQEYEKRDKEIKAGPGRGNSSHIMSLPIVMKMDINGRLEGRHTSQELDKLKPVNSDHHTVSPNKGGGFASFAPKQTPGATKEQTKAYRKSVRALIENHKMAPLNNENGAMDNHMKVVDYLVGEAHSAMKSALSPEDMRNVKNIVIPPVTRTKKDDVHRTLVHMVAERLAKKIGAKYDPFTLGLKDFESKKLAYAERLSAYNDYFEKFDFNSIKGLDSGDTMLVDDIMTTGTTALSIHKNLAGYEYAPGDGKRGTPGTGKTNSSKKRIKGKLHTYTMLRNY